MSTISKKTPQLLVKEFSIHPKLFQNYSKHGLWILETYLWMKENQYNDEVNSIDFLQNLLKSYGREYLEFYYAKYLKDVVSILPDEDIKEIKSDIYLKQPKETMNFGGYEPGELSFILLENKGDVDEQAKYRDFEVYNMSLYSEVVVLDSFLTRDSEYYHSEDDSREYISKTTDSFYTCKDEGSLHLWCTINSLFCDYVRYQIVDFSDEKKTGTVNLNIDFYQTLDSLLEVTNSLIKNYKKRGKNRPAILDKPINECLNECTRLRERFEKCEDKRYLIQKNKEPKKNYYRGW